MSVCCGNNGSGLKLSLRLSGVGQLTIALVTHHSTTTGYFLEILNVDV
jgi:hypothetical protein